MGSALQLQQATLWSQASYIGLLLLASALWALAWFTNLPTHWRRALTAISVALLAFSADGLRASVFLADALEPGLGGQDLSVTGGASDAGQGVTVEFNRGPPCVVKPARGDMLRGR